MIQVYTGNGKGKTTAAIGLALRAAGNGLKVYICQFLKAREYGECRELAKIKNITLKQFGRGCFIKKRPVKKDALLAKMGLDKARKIIAKGEYDLIILDEINVALKLRLLTLIEVKELLESIPAATEVVLTGRWAHPAILKKADLVSEIKEKKHYFKKGFRARRGIEF